MCLKFPVAPPQIYRDICRRNLFTSLHHTSHVEEDLKRASDLLEKDTDSSELSAETGSWVSQRAALSDCSVSSALWERLGRSQTGELLYYSLVKASNLYCNTHGLYNPWIQISHIPAVHGLTELQQHCQIFGACLHQIPSFKPDRVFLLRLMFRAVIHLSAERLWTHKSHQLQD